MHTGINIDTILQNKIKLYFEKYRQQTEISCRDKFRIQNCYGIID